MAPRLIETPAFDQGARELKSRAVRLAASQFRGPLKILQGGIRSILKLQQAQKIRPAERARIESGRVGIAGTGFGGKLRGVKGFTQLAPGRGRFARRKDIAARRRDVFGKRSIKRRKIHGGRFGSAVSNGQKPNPESQTDRAEQKQNDRPRRLPARFLRRKLSGFFQRVPFFST